MLYEAEPVTALFLTSRGFGEAVPSSTGRQTRFWNRVNDQRIANVVLRRGAQLWTLHCCNELGADHPIRTPCGRFNLTRMCQSV